MKIKNRFKKMSKIMKIILISTKINLRLIPITAKNSTNLVQGISLASSIQAIIIIVLVKRMRKIKKVRNRMKLMKY